MNLCRHVPDNRRQIIGRLYTILGDERLVLHPRNLAVRDALFCTGRCEPSGRAPIPSNTRAPLNYGPRPRETRQALASNEPAACIGIRQCLRHGCGAAGASVIVRATRGRELLDGVAEGATPGTAQAKGPRAKYKSGEWCGHCLQRTHRRGTRSPSLASWSALRGRETKSLRYKGQMGRVRHYARARPISFTTGARSR